MKHATIATWTVGLFGLALLATPASAQDWAGTFDLEGRHDALGAFTGRLELRAEGDGFAVVETAEGPEYLRTL